MRLTPPWRDAVFARLDERLCADADRPLALALSGGGDSVALMHLAAEWAQTRKRRVLALTVDHGLNARSAEWSRLCEAAAAALGLGWRGLVWSGPKPDTGLPAAARQARHALIADAAREAGANVVLFAHTADDVAETDWMRGAGASIGRLREWAPSPVWPQGRALMLLRPLLDVSRIDLRTWLSAIGAAWVEDPANEDPRFLRTRARRSGLRAVAGPPEDAAPPADLSCDDDGLVRGPLDTPWLAQAIASASGGQNLPSRRQVEAVRLRLQEGAGSATLSGARILRDGDRIAVMRELGRGGVATMDLMPGRVSVWDGRWTFTTREPGWRVAAAAGRQASLTDRDRSRLQRLPAAARTAHPVLFREDAPRPLLAGPSVEAESLVADRLALACGEARREDDLGRRPWRGPVRRPI